MSQTQGTNTGAVASAPLPKKNSAVVEPKMYVLLESLRSEVPIYVMPSKGKKLKQNKIPKAKAYLQTTFTSEEGETRTMRLKLNSTSVWLDEQIEKGIPANAKYTVAERRAVEFKNEILVTSSRIVQEFLDNHPQNEKFKGSAPDGERPLFKEYNPVAVAKSTNEELKRRVKAANIILDLGAEDAKKLLVAVKGAFHTVPTDIVDVQNELFEYIDDEDKGVENVIAFGEQNKEGKTQLKLSEDQKVKITLSKLIAAKLVSFTEIKGYVSIKKGDKYEKMKAISEELSQEERLETLVSYLTTDETGKTFLEELNKMEQGFGKSKTE